MGNLPALAKVVFASLPLEVDSVSRVLRLGSCTPLTAGDLALTMKGLA